MPERRDFKPREGDGRTYYGQPQLKPAPFNNALVGSYVFMAGLSGAAQLLATIADLTRGRSAEPTVRRGRFLSLLAPLFGTACLIADLHTPKRFYNMLRVFKLTSPMSLGSWGLVGFGIASSITAVLHYGAERLRWLGWLRGVARVTQIPAALTGAGLATYTASLFSATSTPLWAAAPKSLAVRYGATSVASAASLLGLGAGRARIGRDMDAVAVAALAAELAAALAGEEQYRRAGISVERDDPTTVLGTVLPLGMLLASLLFTRSRSRPLTTIASLATLAGSLAMRIQVMHRGDESARRPEISMRFAQPTSLHREG